MEKRGFVSDCHAAWYPRAVEKHDEILKAWVARGDRYEKERASRPQRGKRPGHEKLRGKLATTKKRS
jgi:hypothetical protein